MTERVRVVIEYPNYVWSVRTEYCNSGDVAVDLFTNRDLGEEFFKKVVEEIICDCAIKEDCVQYTNNNTTGEMEAYYEDYFYIRLYKKKIYDYIPALS